MILNKAYLKKVYDELSPEEKSKYEEELNKNSEEKKATLVIASEDPIKIIK